MAIKTIPFGKPLDVHLVSDVESLSFSGGGLAIRVARKFDQNGEVLGLEVLFESVSAFRYLDEVDLVRYWSSEEFLRGFHVLEVTEGGWSDEENALQGYETTRKEWLVVTGNRCISVFSTLDPKLNTISWPAEEAI